MSTTIDQRVVEMRFDNSNFENNVKTSMTTLEKLKRALKFDGASKGLENIQSSANKVNFSGMSRGVDVMTQKFSYMQMTIQHQLNNIVDSAVNAGKRMVSALTIDPVKSGFQEYETQINAVQTILANTQHNGTTLDEVNSALDTLNTYADKTIYNFTEMTRNIGTFTAAGVDLQTSVDSIQGIANLAAVSGSTSQQASTAMYQLSQALAAGKVSLMDWNSVVNAGMGGKVFQDALVRTSELLKTGAKDVIATSGSFRESLTKSGWLTTEVLTETLKQFSGAYSEADLIAQGFTESQAKEIANMAVTAEDAATKVKTFTQLWDTLKEAAQSGWTQTWELIVGDFDEAKGLLTSISDTVGNIINKSAESRNNLLGEALNSPWKKLIQGVNDAGIKTDEFQSKVKELYDTAKGEGSFDKVVESYGSFEKACRKGAISTDVLKEAITGLTGKVVDLSNIKVDLKLGDTGEDVKKVQEALQNLNYDIGKTGADGILGSSTEEAIKAFQEANNLEITGIVDEETISALEKASGSAGKLTSNIEGLLGNLDELGGREKLIESFKNIWEGLLSIITPIKMAFRKIFPPATSEQLTSVIDKFHALSEKMTISSETSGKIYNVFKGLFSIISFGIGILKSIGSAILTVVSSLFGFSGSILDAAGALGKWISNCIDSEKENNILTSGIEFITSIITGAITKIQEFGKTLKENFKTPDGGGIFGFFTNLWDVITQIGSGVAKAVGSIFSTISEAFGKGDVFEVLNSGLIAGIFFGIKKFVNGITDVFEGAGGFLENVTGILDDVRGCFKAYQEQIKAGTLLKIASAIAILAAAIFVISTIDADDLGRSLVAIGILFVELLGSLEAFTKITKKMKGVSKSCAAMISISIAVLILAGALKKISSVSWEGIAKGLIAIGALMAEISIFLNTAKFDGKMTRTALGIVLLSSAMLILAKAVKSFGSMKWSQIGKGLAAIGGLLLEISLFTRLTGNAKKVLSTGAAMVLLGASMKIFASAMKDFGSMEWSQIGKGFVSMGGALTEVAIAMRLMPKGSVFKATGLLVAAAALKVIYSAMSDFGGMNWDQIGKGLVVMGGALAELAIGLNLMKGTMKGSASLLIAASALAIIAPVMKSLGKLSWEQIAKGLITLAGAFAVIGIAGALLSPMIPAILGLTAAFVLLGLGMAGIGAGLLMISAGITGLTTSLAVGATSIVAGLSAIILGILNLVPEIAQIIGTTIVEVAKIIGEYAPELATSFLKLITETLKSLATYAPQITDSLAEFLIGVINSLANHMPALIEAFFNLLSKVFEGVVDALNGVDTTNLLKGMAAVGLMSALAYILSGVLSIIPSAMAGLLGIGVLVAELALVLAALGGLNQIPGLQWLISEGGEFLGTIGNALGKAIGALIGGIGEGLTDSLPQIGQNIADFMDKLAIASENASGIKSGSFDGVSDLVGALGSIGLATVGTTISDIFTLGGTSMEKFEKDGIAFFNAMKAISSSATGVTVDEESMGSVIAIATKLSELQSSLEPIGGVIDWFTGRDDLATFGENAGQFMSSMSTALGSLVDVTVNQEALTAIISASTELSKLQSSLDSIGGVVDWFVGRDDLATFGENVGSFMSSMSTALNSLGDVTVNQEALTAIIDASTKLSTLQSSLENIGGVVDWFTGRDDLATFGTNAGQFMSSMATALGSLGDITVNQEALTAIIDASTKLSTLQSSLESIGGVVDWFTGRDDLATFGTNAGQFMSSMGTALNSLGDVTVNQEALTAIIDASTKLSTLQSSLENIGGVVDWFTGRDDLATFGTNAGQFMSSMATALGSLGDITVNQEALTAIIDASTKLAGLQSSLESIGGVVDWFTGRDDLATFGTNAGSFMTSMSTAFSGLEDTAINEEAMTSIINAATKLAELQSSLENMGGVISWFIGRDDLGTFGEKIGQFASAMGTLKTSMGEDGIPESVVTSVTNAGNALLALNDALPEEGWFDSKITMDDFSDYITNFADAIADFSEKASGIDDSGINIAITTAYRIKGLISAISDLDASGVSTFTGVGTGGIGADGVAYDIAQAMKAFGDKVAGIDVSAVSTASTAALKIKNLIAGLVGLDTSGVENFKPAPIGSAMKSYSDKVKGLDSGSVSSSISIARRLKSFITGLSGLDTSGVSNFKPASIGSALKTYNTIVSGIDLGAIISSITAGTKMKNFISSLSGLDTSGVSSFKSAVSSLAKVNISAAAKSLNKTADLSSSGTKMMSSLSQGVSSSSSKVNSAVTSTISNMLSKVNSQVSSFTSAGAKLMTGLASGIKSRSALASSAASSAASNGATGARSYWNSYYRAGTYLGDGLISGINAKKQEAYNAGYQLGRRAAQGVADGSDEESPSKLTIQYGKYLGEGLIIGINKTVRSVYNTSEDLGKTAAGAITSTVAKIADVISSGIDTQPTIRPVLDLSDIESGVGTMSSMLDMNSSVGVMSNVSAISSMMSQRNQNGANDDIVSAINKLSKKLDNVGGDTYSIGGITYDDGSNISEAVKSIVRAARVERRI